MVLIGGKKLQQLGSDRHTDDIDFLIYNKNNKELFIQKKDMDIINAANNKFYSAIWFNEIKENEITLNGLLLTCCYTLIQHCQNFNFRKADAKEYDIRFLVRLMNEKKENINLIILKNNVHSGEFEEIQKIINSVKI